MLPVPDERSFDRFLVLCTGCDVRHQHWLGRRGDKRPVVYGAARSVILHPARIIATGESMAMGRNRGSFHPSDRIGRLCRADSQAIASADLWIVSRISSGNCGIVWRIVYAPRGRQPAAREVIGSLYSCEFDFREDLPCPDTRFFSA